MMNIASEAHYCIKVNYMCFLKCIIYVSTIKLMNILNVCLQTKQTGFILWQLIIEVYPEVSVFKKKSILDV